MMDAYFSADVETDGPIPGPYSMLSFALVYAGRHDGKSFVRADNYDCVFYRELKPISDEFEKEALEINGLDRDRLKIEGSEPHDAMFDAAEWIKKVAGKDTPVLSAYPASFDWSWLFWYFHRFNGGSSPFNHSRCFDVKTAVSVSTGNQLSKSNRKSLSEKFRSVYLNNHHAVDDAIAQADILGNVFEYVIDKNSSKQ